MDGDGNLTVTCTNMSSVAAKMSLAHDFYLNLVFIAFQSGWATLDEHFI